MEAQPEQTKARQEQRHATQEPHWLTHRMLGAIHADQIRQHRAPPYSGVAFERRTAS